MDVLALINQNYLLTSVGLWEHHSCNGYISERLKGLACVELTDGGQFIMWSEGTIQYLYDVYKCHSKLCMYIYPFICAHVCCLFRFTSIKIHCNLEKMENRKIPPVVQYEARVKSLFLDPTSLLYKPLSPPAVIFKI